MKRKVKKNLAFLLALTLMLSLMGKDRLFVAAETQQIEVQNQTETSPSEVMEIEEEAPEQEELSSEAAEQSDLSQDHEETQGSGGESETNAGTDAAEDGTAKESAPDESVSEIETESSAETKESSTESELTEEETVSEETAVEETEETTLEETEELTEEETTEEETVGEETEDADYKGSEKNPWSVQADVQKSDAEITVRAYAEKGVLPEDAVLYARELKKTEDEYKEAESLIGISDEKEMLALDIGFTVLKDGEETEVEPDGEVRIEMDLSKIVPADVEETSLEISHITEDENGEKKAVTVADNGNGTEGTVAVVDTDEEDTQDVKAEFVTDGFSTFTITWMTAGAATLSLEGARVSIEDEIMTSGELRALVKDSSGNEITEQLEYQWYVSENGNSWNAIEDTSTVDSKEASYYVARDGARKYYKVIVKDGLGNELESSSFHVSYYDSLQNGSFEEPVVSESDYQSYQNAHFIQIPNGTDGLEWKTSARGPKWNDANAPNDYYIEIADGSNKRYGRERNNPQAAYNISSAAEGDQFAELNCQVAGALYQDILTQPGSTLYWSLQHAGRQGKDTMAVIISNTAELPNDWNPSEDNYNDRPEDVKAVITDGPGTWNYYTGTYVVPEGQYVTRFYFVAVGASGGSADGNLLDNITFGKDVPTPPASKGFLTISKNVEGIDSSQIAEGTFEFTVSGEGKEFTVSLPNAAGEWSYTLLDLEPGSYTVTENVKKADGLEGYKLSSTGYVVENESYTDGNTATVNVTKKQTSQVSFTNGYEELTSDLVVRKAFDFGGMEDEQIARLKEQLTFVIKAEDGEEKTFGIGQMTETEAGIFSYTAEGLEAGVYEVTESGQDVENYTCDTTKTGFDTVDEMSQTDKVTLVAGVDKEVTFTNTYTRIQYEVVISKIVDGNLGDREKDFTFHYTAGEVEGKLQLSNGETRKITVNAGDELMITENGFAEDGYDVEITAIGTENESSVKGTYRAVVSEQTTITFKNTRKIVNPPTGLSSNAMPYLCMILISVGAAVWFVITRRRKI